MKVYIILLIFGVSKVFGNELSNRKLNNADADTGVNTINLLFTKLNVLLEDNYKTYTNLMETYTRFQQNNITMESLMKEALQKQSENFNLKLRVFNEICHVKMELLQVFQKQKEDFALKRLKDQNELLKRLQIPNDVDNLCEPEKRNNEGLADLNLEIQNLNDRLDNQTLHNANISLVLQNIDKRLKDHGISIQIVQENTKPSKRYDQTENVLQIFAENITSIEKSLIKIMGQQKLWTAIQRRQNGSVDFNRNWAEYKAGFGNQNDGEFFIGLEKLSELTRGGVELLIIMEDFNNEIRYAKYSKFEIGIESEKYVIKQWAGYSGNAGDSLIIHRNEKFSTNDQDNDNNSSKHCAQVFNGGWWFYSCPDSHTSHSNLNGLYLNNNSSNTGGIVWGSWHGSEYSLKYVEMLVR